MSDQPAGLSLLLPGEDTTARLAEDVAAVLKPGDLVALSGGLGTGKTTFARALLRSLAGDTTLEVQSPTFPLRIDHPLDRLTVVHADLYRLGSPAELGELGLDEAVTHAALLVEWPEKLADDIAGDRLDIALDIEAGGRRATIVARGSWPARLARTARIRAFLDQNGFRNASRAPIAGDASARAYERIAPASENAPPLILMNAPARSEGLPIYDGRSYDAVAHRTLDIRPFIAIDHALRDAGLHAPAIHAADVNSGLLLLEDLGRDGVVDANGTPIVARYEAAIDALLHLHARDWPAELPLPDGGSYAVPAYDRDALLIEISLFADYPGEGGEPFEKEGRGEFFAAWSAILDQLDQSSTTLVLRDFHSPNILWQPAAEGLARVGLIDFQDALIGHPAYDVASLAKDARVSLSEADEARLKARYVVGRIARDPGFDEEAFDLAYAILGLQRATKVLGIFTRLAVNEGKPGYQRHRPRLKALIRQSLDHPVLSALRVWYEPHL